MTDACKTSANQFNEMDVDELLTYHNHTDLDIRQAAATALRGKEEFIILNRRFSGKFFDKIDIAKTTNLLNDPEDGYISTTTPLSLEEFFDLVSNETCTFSSTCISL